MNSAILEHRVVRLEDVRQNNIVEVKLNAASSNMLFKQEYGKTAKIVKEIVARRTKIKEGCRNYDRYERLRIENAEQNLSEFHSVIAFIGDRGTGKTSVMQSVLNHLKESIYCREENQNTVFPLGKENEDVRFTVFDTIDSGFLTGTEDIMEIILSRMLHCLQESEDAERYREIYRKIDDLYRDLNLAYWNGQKSEKNLFSLQRIADSQHTIQSFKELIQDFNEAMRSDFVVIALDDVDMYQGSGKNSVSEDPTFTLLDHIYNHFRIPGLIVLMTFNEHVLKQACNRHFAQIYSGTPRLKKLSADEMREVHKLSMQFMSKLIPFSQRVYMPEYGNMHSVHHCNLYILPILVEQGVEKRLPPFKDGENEVLIKDFMLRLIAYRTGVYYDVAGSKQHFFEPRNLREICDLVQVLLAMEEIPQGDEQLAELSRSRNRQLLLEYFNNQFTILRLDGEEMEFVGLLSSLPTERRNNILIEKIRERRSNTGRDDTGFLEKAKSNRWSYSYGELLHNLYFATRIKDRPYSKAFVQTILGMNSIMLCQKVGTAEYRERLLKETGSSIAGRWANEMLPTLVSTGISKAGELKGSPIGSINLPVNEYYDNLEIPRAVTKDILSLLQGSSEGSELKEFMKAFVMQSFFFTKGPQKGLRLVLNPIVSKDTELSEVDDNTPLNAIDMTIRSEVDGEHICFNVMNFAVNLLDTRESDDIGMGFLDRVKEDLIAMGKRFAEKLLMPWDKIRQSREEEMNRLQEGIQISRKKYDLFRSFSAEYSIAKAEYEEAVIWLKLKDLCTRNGRLKADRFRMFWTEFVNDVIHFYKGEIDPWAKEKRLALPTHQFDMMYNMLKRCAYPAYYEKPETVSSDGIVPSYVILYENLANELEKQDKVYMQNEGTRSLAAALKESVFYRIITAGEKDPDYNKYLEPLLKAIVESSAGMGGARELAKHYG